MVSHQPYRSWQVALHAGEIGTERGGLETLQQGYKANASQLKAREKMFYGRKLGVYVGIYESLRHFALQEQAAAGVQNCA